MSLPVNGPRGPECCCGAELRSVPLPSDLAALSGETAILVHAGTGDTHCYPESSSPEDAALTAEPIDGDRPLFSR